MGDVPSQDPVEQRLSFQTHVRFAVCLFVLIGLWYFSTPGPFLFDQLAGRVPTLASGSAAVAVSFLFLFILPFLFQWFFLETSKESIFGLGNWKEGFLWVILGALIAVPFVFLGGRDPAICQAYPWAGTYPGLSLSHACCWFSIYSVYYFGYEFFFRGFILHGFKKDFGIWAAVWLQLILSVAVHFGKPMMETVAAVPAGLFLAWIVIRTKSIWYVIILHFLIGIANDLGALFHKNQLEFGNMFFQ